MRAVILLGGPNKGTRFRPLSLDLPKPLFPVAGRPILEHQIEQCIDAGISDIFLLGSYPATEFEPVIRSLTKRFEVQIRYLFEYEPMSTAGGIFHYRDTLQRGSSDDTLLVLNADVCNMFSLSELREMHQVGDKVATVLAVKSEIESSKAYGCLVIENDEEHGPVEHFVEKPATFVSATISCGIYMFKLAELIKTLKATFTEHGESQISMERQVLPHLTHQQEVYGCVSNRPFAQIKSASSAVSVSAIYLEDGVFVDQTAQVHPEAKLGPNVTIGAGAVVKQGARIRNAIILDNATVGEHAVVLDSIIGWESTLGAWCRVEGCLPKVNPNTPNSRVESDRLFDNSGKFMSQCAVLGRGVTGSKPEKVADEHIIRNCIVMPSKEIEYSAQNQIIL